MTARSALQKWYHGTETPFKAMETQHSHTFGLAASETPLFFSPVRSFAKMYAGGPDGTIYTANLKWRKVFDGYELSRESRYWPPGLEDMTPEGKVLYEDLEEGRIFSGIDGEDEGIRDLLAGILRMDYDIIETDEFKRWLKKNGYDAAYVTGDGEKNVFVFSPKQVEIIDVEVLRPELASARRVASRYAQGPARRLR